MHSRNESQNGVSLGFQFIVDRNQ